MIKKLRMTNFRGVKEGEIELGDLTILVGSNNSAKTTILEALFLLPNPLRDAPYILPEPRMQLTAASLIHEMHKTLNCEGYAFLLHKYVSDQAIVKWNDTDYLRLLKQLDELYLDTNKISKFPSQSTIKTKSGEVSIFGSLGLSHNTISDLRNKRNREVFIAPNSLLISAEIIRYAQWYIHSNWAQIANLKVPVEVAKDTSSLVNENFVNITIEPFLAGRLSIFGLLDDGTRIRLGDLGSGTQVYIVARILYEIIKPQILLWDDVEAHMNPRLLVRIAEWFSELNESGVQVVITTHSIETARMLTEFNKDATILVTSLKDGILKIKKITSDDLEMLTLAGIDIRMADAVIL